MYSYCELKLNIQDQISQSTFRFELIIKVFPCNPPTLVNCNYDQSALARLRFWPVVYFRRLDYLFPSRYLATRTELRQRQWQQNRAVTGEEDDSDKVRRAPPEVTENSGGILANHDRGKSRPCVAHAGNIYLYFNFISSYISILA